jgi:hypothetical protein
MARTYGYISPLLSNLAEDYSRKAREGLVGPLIFPRVMVGKPSGKYAVFNKERVQSAGRYDGRGTEPGA